MQHQDAPGPNTSGSGERLAIDRQSQQQGVIQPGRQSPTHYPPATNGGPSNMMTEPHRAKDGGAFIDQALRERVDGDIVAFLAAFDAALADDTVESRAGLREATDRLLRAGARTRIELERLEARIPLPPRDGMRHRRGAHAELPPKGWPHQTPAPPLSGGCQRRIGTARCRFIPDFHRGLHRHIA
jgi:hypothetical protein